MNKCQDWYNNNAKRNNGYKSAAKYIKEGISGEDVFEQRLIELLVKYENVLDIGCGHGEFTLKMSQYAKKITGGDSSVELLKIAKKLKNEANNKNAEFKYIHTHEIAEDENEQYDLIYNRRGPTSIYEHKNLLREGGKIIAIHPLHALDKVKDRLKFGGFIDIETEIYDACSLIFDNAEDFSEHLSSSHMSKDYRLAENKEELDKLLIEHTVNGRLTIAENRFIVTAK